MICKERIEYETSMNVSCPRHARQFLVRRHDPRAVRLRENPTGLISGAVTSAKVASEMPQLIAVAAVFDDSDERDIPQASAVAGLCGVGDGEAFEGKDRHTTGGGEFGQGHRCEPIWRRRSGQAGRGARPALSGAAQQQGPPSPQQVGGLQSAAVPHSRSSTSKPAARIFPTTSVIRSRVRVLLFGR